MAPEEKEGRPKEPSFPRGHLRFRGPKSILKKQIPQKKNKPRLKAGKKKKKGEKMWCEPSRGGGKKKRRCPGEKFKRRLGGRIFVKKNSRGFGLAGKARSLVGGAH